MLAQQWEGFSRLKEDAMKRKIGLALATGLALLIAGCSSQSTSGGAGGSGGGAGAPAENPAAASTSRNFNLAVKCPGVHWEKKHGWSDQQIMQQESVEAEDIPACEQWVQAQPKGYVPPPPGGAAPANGQAAPAGAGAPAPAPASHS
jgi:hypothetical protein